MPQAPNTSGCTATKWTAECIAAAGASAGFGRDRATLERLVAVALAESGGNPSAVNRNTNGSIDVGLMQINSIHGYKEAEMKIPSRNMAAAWSISGEGRNWKPWVAFNTGAYLLHIPAAKAGVASLVGKGYSFGTDLNITNEPNPDNFQDNPLVPDSVEELGRNIQNIAEFPARVLAWISNRDNIFRLIKAGMGVSLVIVGLAVVARPLTKPIVDTATQVVGVAKKVK